MAVLRRTLHGLRRHTAAAALVVTGAGCVLFDALGTGDKALAFSHQVHVEGEKLRCTSCHESYAVSDDPGMPSADSCQACHDEIDADAPPEKQVSTLFDGDTFKAAHASKLSSEVIFSHKLHARDDSTCGACHTGIQANEVIDEDVGVRMSACMDCHAERGVANQCATCHTQIREDWAPENHRHEWIRMHGSVVRADTGNAGDTCAMCHTESQCIDCHEVQPPQSHTNFFRLRGHGMIASMDRDSCFACHRTDSCDKCHENTLPLSHTGSFGGTRSTHCLGCHFPLKGESCFACHKTAPSHALAAPKPPWHTPAMNCRQCHGLSAPLPHVDNGSDCNACHH